MAPKVAGARKQVEMQLAVGEGLYRAARLDAKRLDGTTKMWQSGKLAQAEECLREVVVKAEALGREDLDLILNAYASLSLALNAKGRWFSGGT